MKATLSVARHRTENEHLDTVLHAMVGSMKSESERRETSD
jgi:hypothetical protein